MVDAGVKKDVIPHHVFDQRAFGILSQATIQKAPTAPVTTKADRQPKWIASKVTMTGAKREPAAAPLLNIPLARARSLGGNNRFVTLKAAGQLNASPTPSKNLQPVNADTERVRPVRIPASDHKARAIGNTIRGPCTSTSQPPAIWKIA